MVMIPKKGSKATEEAVKTQAPAAPPAAQAPAAPAVEAAAPVEATPAPTPAPAVPAIQRSTSVAVAGKAVDVLAENYKNALRVDWNTLHRLQANNGNFLDLENNKKALGSEMVLEIMSFQDNWQISPGVSDPDAAQYVRYSDDGRTTNQGEDCVEYLAALKEAGYQDAKLTQRVTLAGVVESMRDASEMEGKMIQIDLSQTSRGMFDRHRFQIALDIQKGRRNADTINRVKMKCNVQSRGANSWTTVAFDYAPAIG